MEYFLYLYRSLACRFDSYKTTKKKKKRGKCNPKALERGWIRFCILSRCQKGLTGPVRLINPPTATTSISSMWRQPQWPVMMAGDNETKITQTFELFIR